MTQPEEILLLVLGGSVLVWLGLALYVVFTRLLHDTGASIMQRARGMVAPGLYDALAGKEVDLEPLLRRLSGRTIERYASDTNTPEPVAAALAVYVLEMYPETILSRAQPTSRRPAWQRIAALRILTRAGWAAAFPLLEQALESEDESVVAAAVTTLGELSDRRASELLVGALRRDLFPRSRIAAQLDTFPVAIPSLLVPLLGEFESQLRFWGATLLGRYAGDTAVDLELAVATGDEDPSVRAAAVESLASGGGPAAIGAALALLDDPVWFVRAHAARALRAFERDDLAAAVAPLLADEAWWVRSAAKETLEARPASAALDMLVDYLEHPDQFARNGAAEVLQNTGALDTLVARAVEDGFDADLSTLRRILSAGGRRLVTTAAARGGLDATGLINELAPVGP